jgi:zinc/manganese transport system substrate-binding protein
MHHGYANAGRPTCWSLAILLLWSLFFFPLAAQAEKAKAEKLRVVASFSILADMAHRVAGENASVTALVGPGGDTHVYEPSAADARAVAGADIVIVNGLGFEGWMDRLIQSSGFKGRIVVASDGIDPLMTGGVPDPHAWQSLGNGKLYVANIRDALMKADAAHAAAYEENARQYQRDLGELDLWVRDQIARVPEDKRRAITTHDALGYFAYTYHVDFIAPLGLSTSGEVSAGGLARLIDEIRAKHVRAVFLENMTDPRLMNQLVADGGAVIGGTLYSDALSPPDGPAPTYIALFRHNVTTMTGAMMKN